MDESNKTVEINDSMGRVITMRPINVLDQIRLLRAIGPINHATSLTSRW